MERLHVFTSAAVNYLPKVRMLCRSIRKHHPEATIHLALADERPAWLTTENEPFDSILEISQLGIPRWLGWAFGHTIVELSTAIKPFAIQHLLARPDCDAVVYFDPDMVLFSRVDDILERLSSANVVLTPHQNKPETTLQAVIDNEITSLRMGVFNLGFVGVRNTAEGKRFAEWWGERCYEFCRAEVHNGIFTDQKWINFAPIFFDGVGILKSSRHNVATWNLTTRVLTGDLANGFQVDGEPLGFYHFTGFDSGAHRIMAVKNASGNQAVQELITWYSRETATRKGDEVESTPWKYGKFSDGTKILPHHRWVYRDRRDLQAAYPDPFDTEVKPLSFLDWCNTEGTLRYPEFFEKSDSLAPYPTTFGTAPVKLAMALRLGMLMFQPRAGKLMRERVMRVFRREGFGGIARRIRGQMQGS